MLLEQERVLKEQPENPPPDYGVTIMVAANQGDAAEMVRRLKEIW
jgi:hypothetical protein